MSRASCAIAFAIAALACSAPAVVPTATARPAYCAPAQAGAPQEITATPASPYFVHHPRAASPLVPTIVFLPGSSGARRNALRAWDQYLAGGKGVDAFRIVIPYWNDLDITEDFHRTLAIIDEVIACYGGDVRQIHLAGFSNGGHAAFDLMLEDPGRFATLLGIPGEFELGTTVQQLTALRGKAVFNGIGALDDEFWHKGVRDAQAELVSAGVDSVYVEFAGQGHAAGPDFPKDRLFDFWLSHSILPRG